MGGLATGAAVSVCVCVHVCVWVGVEIERQRDGGGLGIKPASTQRVKGLGRCRGAKSTVHKHSRLYDA